MSFSSPLTTKKTSPPPSPRSPLSKIQTPDSTPGTPGTTPGTPKTPGTPPSFIFSERIESKRKHSIFSFSSSSVLESENEDFSDEIDDEDEGSSLFLKVSRREILQCLIAGLFLNKLFKMVKISILPMTVATGIT
eukprot:Pgem_evm1s12518